MRILAAERWNAAEIRGLAKKESLPIHVLEMDVTDDASVERGVAGAVAKAGWLDVAINMRVLPFGVGGSGYYGTGGG